ncbi:MAG: hypothetical protein A2084_00920 [Tenericutes bacterium GWC2_39_45]|nr:MAG: hypothetical protein A2084_00920 [Tenericutes bacterium GWC2_39_45]HBG33138.1 hypothetical protein [Acholeplasmataceae bacterium]
MSDLMFLESIFKEQSWGGDAFIKTFEYEILNHRTGEAYVISGISDADLKIKNGKFKNLNLGSVYRRNRHLFNNLKSDKFPYLVRLLDVNEDIGVEVHSEVAKAYYVLDAKKDAKILIGHGALSKEELKHNLNELMIERPVSKGDFIYVPAGVAYALLKGVLMMELRLSSGKTFTASEQEAEFMSTVSVPSFDEKIAHKTFLLDASRITQFLDKKAFTVEKWEIRDVLDLENKSFKMMSVISGKGFINGTKLKKGEHLIILSDTKHIQLEGNMELIVSYL